MDNHVAQRASTLEEEHEAEMAPSGKKEVKYPFAFKKFDWKAYHHFRPCYPDTMFHTWLSYHTGHGNGLFNSALDVGAGPGTVAQRLIRQFDRVIVSDAGQANIIAAEDMMSVTVPLNGKEPRFTFLHCPSESVHSLITSGSVDFACVAMAFHFFDAINAIKSIAATLKPGATLAAVTYGFIRLKFPGSPQLEDLWYRVTSMESLRLIREGLFPAAVRGMAAAMSGLDFVPLPEDLFVPGAKRIMVNVEESERRPLCFVDEDQPCWQAPPNLVGTSDRREFIHDHSWRRKVDTLWLKGFLKSSNIGFGHKTWDTEEWKQLENVVFSSGGYVTAEWPVAMILATRNDKPVTW